MKEKNEETGRKLLERNLFCDLDNNVGFITVDKHPQVRARCSGVTHWMKRCKRTECQTSFSCIPGHLQAGAF